MGKLTAHKMGGVSFTVEVQLELGVMPAHSDNKHNSLCALMKSISCLTFGDSLAELEG